MSLAEGASTRQPNPIAGHGMLGPEGPQGRNSLGKRLDLHVLRALAPYLWTANSWALRARILVALCLLLVSTSATVYVPMLYKAAVDALTAKGEVPVALVNGRDEPFVRLSYLDTLAGPALWHGMPIVIEDAGHAPFWDQPTEC